MVKSTSTCRLNRRHPPFIHKSFCVCVIFLKPMHYMLNVKSFLIHFQFISNAHFSTNCRCSHTLY